MTHLADFAPIARDNHIVLDRRDVRCALMVALCGCADAGGRDGSSFGSVSASGLGTTSGGSSSGSTSGAGDATSTSMATDGGDATTADSTGMPTVDPCTPIEGVAYDSSPTVGPVTDRPAEEHGDLNLQLRGWSVTGGTLGLIQIEGPTDALAPRLNSLFTDDAVPDFVANYAVNHWDWDCNCAGPPIEDWEVTLVGMATEPGEILELPRSGYDIGNGRQARVLYANDDSITLKYTGEDNVVSGYTIHVVGLCVEPSLRALYHANDDAGRAELPALTGDQPIGRAREGEVLVAIRDTGAFMDPRSDKDWWD